MLALLDEIFSTDEHLDALAIPKVALVEEGALTPVEVEGSSAQLCPPSVERWTYCDV